MLSKPTTKKISIVEMIIKLEPFTCEVYKEECVHDVDFGGISIVK
jgi:hypothetical protein